jgi:hypothetical protein
VKLDQFVIGMTIVLAIAIGFWCLHIFMGG